MTMQSVASIQSPEVFPDAVESSMCCADFCGLPRMNPPMSSWAPLSPPSTTEAVGPTSDWGFASWPISGRRAAPPVSKGSDGPIPDTGTRHARASAYCWTLRHFAGERLLSFTFADAEDARS